jgi:hypothetical protein
MLTMKKNRNFGAFVVVLTAWSACGRGVLHTGATTGTLPSAPSVPAPVHDGGTCDPGLVTCPGRDPGYCFDLQSSPIHCGACGNACALGIPCEAGQCRAVSCTSHVSVRRLRVDYGFGGHFQIGLADFDRDGAIDMVTPMPTSVRGDFLASNPDPSTWNSYFDNATVFHGNGDGTFAVGESFPAGITGLVGDSDANQSFSMVAADFNRDQVPDIVYRAVPPSDSLVPAEAQLTVAVRLGNGDGTFGPEIGLAAGRNPSSIAVADFDGDGVPDLVSISSQATRLSVYHGDGDGTFSGRQDLTVGGRPRVVTVTDWNSDGILDLVAADDYVHILLGLGRGGFAPALDCALSLADWAMGGARPAPVIADFDQDGVVDMVGANAVWFGMHECNATRVVTFHSAYNTAMPLTAADLNGDGVPDLVFVSWQGVGYLPSDGHGGFGEPVILGDLDDPQGRAQPDPTNAFAADVNGDGRLDLIVATQISIRVFLNTCK